MTKREYMEQLELALRDVDPATAADIIEDYENHFQSGIAEGRSEEELVKELGNIEDMVGELKDLMKNENQEQKKDSFESGNGAKHEECRCRNLVVTLVSADTIIRMSEDDMMHLDYKNEGSFWNRSKLVFTGYQEGDTYYAKEEVRKENVRKGGFSFSFNGSSELLIRVPKNFGSIQLVSTSGNVKVQNVSELEDLHLKTVSGDMHISGVDVPTIFTDAVSGDVELARVWCKKMNVKSVSGDIRLEHVEYADAELSSVSGDVCVDKLAKNSNTNMTSVSGDVHAQLEEPADANLKTTSGDVRIEIDAACKGFEIEPKSKMGRRIGEILIKSKESIQYENGTFCYGDRSSHIRVGTSSGDIVVRHLI